MIKIKTVQTAAHGWHHGRRPGEFHGGMRPRTGLCDLVCHLSTVVAAGHPRTDTQTEGKPGCKAEFKTECKTECKSECGVGDSVVDVTCPPGSHAKPLDTLVKTWRVTLKGGVEPGARLIFVRGDREVASAEEFPVTPSEEGPVDVSAILSAPKAPGRYVAVFQLANRERVVFGPRLSVEILVVAAPTLEVVKEDVEAKTPEVVEALEIKTPEIKTPEVVKALEMSPWQPQLETLLSMGFCGPHVLDVLHKHRGDVQAVVFDLLNE